jgi:hypothetical protein
MNVEPLASLARKNCPSGHSQAQCSISWDFLKITF